MPGVPAMSLSDIGAVATISVLLTLGLTIIAIRFLPVRALPVATSDQSRYLMDQVISERETARVLRVELDVAKAKIVTLEYQVVERDRRITSLESQVSDLWAMFRGNNVAHSSTMDAARHAQPGNRAKTATAQFSDDDVAFRDWLIRHFDGQELEVLAANAGMDKPVAGPITSMATALVQSARRMGNADALQREALSMRPQVTAW